jgi:beta-glucosidase
VAGWQPVNETNYYAAAKYRGGGWPPGHSDRDEWARATEAVQLATAEAAVRLRQSGAPVASIFGLSTVEAQDRSAETHSRVQREYAVHWDTGLGLFRDGVLRVPGRDPIERPDLAGSFDLIGFSYYAAAGVRAGRIVPHPPESPISPLGYGIWAGGLGRVLDRLQQQVPGTPLLVAEYGVGTDDDTVRAAYLGRGLELIADAIHRGIDVRGLFHWTGVDNYEWLHGYDVAFGIIDRDRNVRPSARVLSAAALS